MTELNPNDELVMRQDGVGDDRALIDEWLRASCGKGIPYGETTDLPSMLHGLAYVLRQIDRADGYKVNIGQIAAAKTSLRMAIDHFARTALSQTQEDK